MIAQEFEYIAPANLGEALALIAGGNAKVLAGGMSLIPLMKFRFTTPERVVDIARLKDLSYIREENGAVHIGATATHYEIETSPLLRGRCPLLAETATHIGDLQVRNMGTIGGSAAHADPAADYPAALQALEARLVLRSADGERTVTAADFFVDTFATALDPGEIVTEVIVPVEDNRTGTSYQKVVHPASGFAVVGVAARVSAAGGKVSMARVGVTGAAGKSYRAHAAEAALEGTAGSAADIEKAAALAADGADLNSDLYASAQYRGQLVRVQTKRALAQAMSRTA